MEDVITTTRVPVPSEEDIAAAERRLSELRERRDNAKRNFFANMTLEDIAAYLSKVEAIQLIRLLQPKLQGPRRKVRGSPVPPELKSSLEEALRQEKYSLSQLKKIFGLSISYISRVKKNLREREGIRNVYEDQRLRQPPPQPLGQ